MRIGTKISVSHILIVFLSLALLAALVAVKVESLFMDALKENLRKQAFGIAAIVKAGNYREKDLQPAVKSLSVRFGSRITLVEASGKVLADSERDPATMANHAGRPEVRKALAGDFGEDLRTSATLNRRMLYVAAPVERLAGRDLIVRVSVPTTKVDDTLRAIPEVAILSLLAIGAVATVSSLFLTRTLVGPISRMTSFARRLSEGHLSERAPIKGGGELEELAISLNRMAESLEKSVRELSSEKNKLQLIVDRMTDGIFLLDRDGLVMLANPSAKKILRLPKEEIEGRCLGDVVPSPQIEKLVRGSAVKGKVAELELEISFPRRRRLKLTSLPLVDDGEIIGALLIAQDRTGQRRLEKMRRDFVANVSHELKTPITGLKLLAETLLRSTDDEEAVRRFAGKLLGDMDRLARLVDDLLVLSSLEAPEKKMERRPVPIGEIATEVAESYVDLASGKGLALTKSIDEGLAPIEGDSRLLRTLVENLVENAVKYTSKGRVEIRVFEDNGKVVLSVADTGPGIGNADIPRVFERFYRVDKGRSKETGGTGLGLSIVKHIAENHGAKVRVESELGVGSTFYVEFPVGKGKG